MQIWQYNVCYISIIVMKDVIAIVEKNRENKELLAIENVDKTAMAEVKKCQVPLILEISIVVQLTMLTWIKLEI